MKAVIHNLELRLLEKGSIHVHFHKYLDSICNIIGTLEPKMHLKSFSEL